jgi:alkylhydroperoxidase/carboxymuconolactone decarboxylase family protein YurZ
MGGEAGGRRSAEGALVSADEQGEPASPALASGELAAISRKFAEGYARVRDVTDRDGACPAWAKALYMAAAAAVKGHSAALARELVRARALGLSLAHAEGAALAVMISRGESVYAAFAAALHSCYGESARSAAARREDLPVTRASALDYFARYFGAVPPYVELMADAAPRALEGYVLMREWALGENALPAKHVELMLCTMNAADFAPRFVNVHANGARRAGASEAEIVEAVLCAIPIAGVASWLPGADGILEGRK